MKFMKQLLLFSLSCTLFACFGFTDKTSEVKTVEKAKVYHRSVKLKILNVYENNI